MTTASTASHGRLLRLGYVGCGFMAQKVHLPNLLTTPGCEVVALAELRQELGRKVQERLRIPRLYSDHQALLADPEIDAICVSGGFMAQGDIGRDAAASKTGRHEAGPYEKARRRKSVAAISGPSLSRPLRVTVGSKP